MTVTATGRDEVQVQAIAEAIGAEVQDAGADYFPQLDGVEAQAVLIDGPGIGRAGPSLTDKLDLPLRLLIAFVTGVALTFLWHYLDDTVRDRAEIEALDVPILGEIPRPSRSWLRRRR